MLNVLGLCAGVGGLELGVGLAEPQSRVVCYVEVDPYCQRVIRARQEEGHLDDAPIWDDLRTFDGREWRGLVDVLAAGFPCQPFSVAGRRLGADDERNLWPDVARVIGEVGPSIVFLENVPAILPYYYHEVLPRLQSMGYRVTEGIFSALQVGAPHRRERLFCMAYANDRRQLQPQGSKQDEWRRFSNGGKTNAVAYAPGEGLEGHGESGRKTLESARSECGSVAWWGAEPAVGRVANGVPDRVGQLRALGNGVVPAVAANAWRVLRGRLDGRP